MTTKSISDLMSTCAACGAEESLEALIYRMIDDDNVRRLIADVMTKSLPLGGLVLRYLRLHKPVKQKLRLDKVAKVLGELLADMQRGAIERKGRSWSIDTEGWKLDAISIVANHHLQSHKGRANGIKAALLSVKTGMSERTLRSAISALRAVGVAVVGTPDTGYYLAQNPEELNECCDFLRRRAMHSLVIEARLKQLSMPELMGQIALDMNLTPAVIPA